METLKPTRFLYIFLALFFCASFNYNFQIYNDKVPLSPLEFMANPDGTVRTLTQSGSDLFLGGDFTTVSGVTKNRIAKVNSQTGQTNPTFDPNANNIVRHLNFINNNLYALGDFTTLNNISRDKRAILNPTDGSSNLFGNFIMSTPHNIVEHDGNLYLSFVNNVGIWVYFSDLRGSNFLKFSSSGSMVNTFQFNQPIHSMFRDNQFLYLGGNFSHVGQYIGAGIKLKKSSCVGIGCVSDSVQPVDSMPRIRSYGGPKIVLASIPDGAGGFFIAGNFSHIGFTPVSNMAHILPNGALNTNFLPNPNGIVHSLASDGTHLYVGGEFSIIGATSRTKLAKINLLNGQVDPNFSPPVNGVAVKKVLVSGEDLYIGGNFSEVSGISRTNLARLNKTNGSLHSLNVPISGGEVVDLGLIENDLYVGGAFTTIGGTNQKYLARLHKDTGIVNTNFSQGPTSKINAFVIDGTDIFEAGNLSDGSNIRKRDRFTGALLPNFALFSGFGNVFSLALDGTNLYAGTDIGQLKKLNTSNGIIDPSFNLRFNYTHVRTISATSTDLYAGGYFESLGLDRNRLVKIDLTTETIDESFKPNVDGNVSAFAIDGDNLYIGGIFTNVNGTTRNRLAKINKNTGTLDGSWDPNVTGTSISTLSLVGDHLYAGGNFTNIGGHPIKNLARVNKSTGQVNTSFNPSPDGQILTLLPSGNFIFAGGSFSSVGNFNVLNLVRINMTTGLPE